MDKRNKRCIHCGDEFKANPKVKNHRYCKKGKCRRARRCRGTHAKAWVGQREKLETEADYRDNQKACWKEWYGKHPDYYREYRKRNPDYTEKNRKMQSQRNILRRKNGRDKVIAKMDLIAGKLLLVQ